VPPPRVTPAASFLLLDEYFANGMDAFVDQLVGLTEPQGLAAFVERWKADPRPWAREKMFDYLARPLTTPGHNVVVKRLFKHAERRNDTPLMAAFLHAFDCLVRRQRKMKWRWIPDLRQAVQEERLVTPRDALIRTSTYTAQNPRTRETFIVSTSSRHSGTLFSYRTRYYLRRRAWRYFRRLGFRAPADYPAAWAKRSPDTRTGIWRRANTCSIRGACSTSAAGSMRRSRSRRRTCG
jgi:hypothetical protein